MDLGKCRDRPRARGLTELGDGMFSQNNPGVRREQGFEGHSHARGRSAQGSQRTQRQMPLNLSGRRFASNLVARVVGRNGLREDLRAQG